MQGIAAVPRILEVVCRTTGMGFAAVARVTEDRWICCAVRDEIAFGLKPGGELKVETTICHEIRHSGRPSSSTTSPRTTAFAGTRRPRIYGFQSYISMPIFLPDGSSSARCAPSIPGPRSLNTPADGRHVQAVRRPDRVSSGCAGAPGRERGGAAQRARASELREQFIAVLGHDLRNPLASIDAGTRC